MITASEKIKIIAKRKNIKIGDLCQALGYSRQNLSQRLKRNTWTQAELIKIAELLNCDLDIIFINKDDKTTI